jgi:two-component system phosphate regulon sensor histidine kinase PhoR
MKHTIFFKILLGFLSINFILIAAVSLISYQIIKNHYIETLRTNLSDTGNSILIGINDLMSQQKYEEIVQYIEKLGEESKIRITVIDIEGVVIADSERESERFDNHRNRPEVITALQGLKGESIRYSTSLNTDMLYQSIPIIDNSEVIGVLRVSIYLDQIDSLMVSLRKEILYVGLLVFMIAFVVIYLFSLRLTKPVRELSQAANEIAKGNLEINVFPHSHDDIGTLCRNFNLMAERIRELIDEIRENENSLDTIINTIHEGLLVIDEKGKIELANKSLKSITGIETLVGKFYWEALRQPELFDFIRRMYSSENDYSGEIVLDDQFYMCSSLALPKAERLVLLYNITGLRKLKQVKKDIVANVSHELRSPLTAIKGFAETLEDEVTPEGKEYLEIIKRNVNRLINIVNDLLTLSKLEQKKSIDLQSLNIREVIDHVARIYRDKIEKKGLGFIVSGNKDIPTIKADEYRIEQLLVNLLENALQYTEKGFIRVTLTREDQFVIMSVEDSGIGIPANQKEKVFERFYVVDKSRSRKYGGTGLGLAIVKHIVLLHNGFVEIETKEGEGTCFIVKLPVSG